MPTTAKFQKSKSTSRSLTLGWPKSAIALFGEKTDGLIVVLKNYTPWVKKLLVRPLDLVLSQRAARLGKTPKLNHGNLTYCEAFPKRGREQLRQNISKLDCFLCKFGLKYTPDALHRWWRFSGKKMSKIQGAVKYMLEVHAAKIRAWGATCISRSRGH